MLVATGEQMRYLDHTAIHDRGIPSTVLMERAAQGLVQASREMLGELERQYIVIYCGAGNNGGDGVAAARLLLQAGAFVRCILVGQREKMSPDCREMERRLMEYGGKLEDFDDAGDAVDPILPPDLFIDAIFGIGLHSPPRGRAADAIALMNCTDVPVLSADIPSGIETDTGRELGQAVIAQRTVTFTLPKPGNLVGAGGACSGRLVVHSIGIPADLIAGLEGEHHLIDRTLVREWLPDRPVDGHKGTFGKCCILAGSVGYTGAPILTSRAAVRTGTGLVFLGVPEDIYTIAAVKSDEAMPSPLPCEDGKLSEEAVIPALEKLAGCDAALIGPGLGRSAGVETVVERVMDTVQYPLVVDADGINALAGNMDILYRRRDCPTIITPHDGEFRRMGGDLSDGDRLTAAQRFAMTFGCLLILKGHRTIVALPGGQTFINTTGNSGMAKGGSGDVLAGMLVSLLAQGLHPVKAACCAVWLHGRAGDKCRERYGERSMTPTDMIAMLGEVFQELE